MLVFCYSTPKSMCTFTRRNFHTGKTLRSGQHGINAGISSGGGGFNRYIFHYNYGINQKFNLGIEIEPTVYGAKAFYSFSRDIKYNATGVLGFGTHKNGTSEYVYLGPYFGRDIDNFEAYTGVRFVYVREGTGIIQEFFFLRNSNSNSNRRRNNLTII